MDLENEPRLLTVPRGIGLIFASTIGSGVFVSTGFMIGRFTNLEIISAWLLGTFIAGYRRRSHILNAADAHLHTGDAGPTTSIKGANAKGSRYSTRFWRRFSTLNDHRTDLTSLPHAHQVSYSSPVNPSTLSDSHWIGSNPCKTSRLQI